MLLELLEAGLVRQHELRLGLKWRGPRVGSTMLIRNSVSTRVLSQVSGQRLEPDLKDTSRMGSASAGPWTHLRTG
eukprot:3089827-Pyramimonas_sp.AAC.1